MGFRLLVLHRRRSGQPDRNSAKAPCCYISSSAGCRGGRGSADYGRAGTIVGVEQAPAGSVRRAVTATMQLDLVGLRWAGAAMIGLGVGLPLLPHNPGLPCPLRTLTGIPCPMCGMTTAVKAVLAGHVQTSVAANPFGIVAVLVAVLLMLRPSMCSARLPISLLAGAALVSWVWELHRFHII